MLTISSPPDQNLQKQLPGQIPDKFGAWGLLNAVRGRRVRKSWPSSNPWIISLERIYCGLLFHNLTVQKLDVLRKRRLFISCTQGVSAAPQQSEICVRFSVFFCHTVFDVNFWWNFPSHTQTLENVARKMSPIFHAKFHDTFGREKRRNFSLLHFCRVAALRILVGFLGRYLEGLQVTN